MSNEINLEVIEGHWDKLEIQIPHALFTIFDQKKLENKLDEIHSKLAHKDKLTLVSGNAKKLLSINCYQAAPRICLDSKVEA